MPFDYQYRVFKRAHRAYKPVREGNKSYHIFSTELVNTYLAKINKSRSISHEKLTSLNRIINAVENHHTLVTRYFNAPFGYRAYLEMSKEYDLTVEASTSADNTAKAKSSVIPLFRKVIIFEALFRAANVDTDTTQKARFIRNLLEIEMGTDKIANTNVYKQLKKYRNAAQAGKESKSRIDDLSYAANQLDDIGLATESRKLRNEVDTYRE